MRTLEIIMPHYNEPWSLVRPFFDVLRNQKGVDFSQICARIVHDGTEPFPDECFEGMPFEVIQYRIDHAGVSAARNYGMDQADSEWITFCDCDDTFSSIYALKFVFDVLGTERHDMLWNEFIMETMTEDGDMVLQVNKKFNMVWTHNKYYRLDFLRKVEARFNEDLYMSEDSAFNTLLYMKLNPDRIGHIKSPMPLYVWCYNTNSVTLKKENLLRNMIGHFQRNVYVYEEFRRREYEAADAMAGRTMTDAYVNATRPDLPEGWEQFDEMVRSFAKENVSVLKRLTENDFARVLKASEAEATAGKFLNEHRPAFVDWLKEMTKAG